MSRLGSIFALGITIVALFILMVYLRGFDFGDSVTTFGDPKSIAATGFIILAAFSMGEFFKQLRIPALLGYIAAGVIFGPNLAPLLPGAPEALFNKQVILDLTLINVLTVGVIGTMGGGELKIADIKDNLVTIFLTVFAIFAIAAPLTFGTVVLLADYAKWMVPFLADSSRTEVYAVAALFSVFAIAMSPAATLAIFQESKAKGSFTSLVLGIVVVADLVLVASFLVTFQFDKILMSPEGFTNEALAAALPVIAAEFGWALLIGLICGIVFIIYLRFIKRERLFFTVAIIFTTSWIAQAVHAEVLLAFLTAGFVVQNFSRHGHDMIHALEKISLPVFVVYFMTQAAQLDLKAVAGFLWLTLVLTIVRTFALYLGSRISTTLTKKDDTTKRHLWLAFFSRGGVDLVLAAMVANSSLPWGVDFQTAIMAVVVVHIIVGPPLLNKALDWAGQTEGSRTSEREDIETFASDEDVEKTARDFPIPQFEEDALNDRLLELRGFLIELREKNIEKPIDHQTEVLGESVALFESGLIDATDKVLTVLADELMEGHQKKEAIRKINTDYLAHINRVIGDWEALVPVAVSGESLTDICDAIRRKESFDFGMRVNREAFLFDRVESDGISRRIIKTGRKIRRLFLGNGTRTVPIGRLWRYYVELTVTRYLAGAVDAAATINEPFWAQLGAHFRSIQNMFDAADANLSNPNGAAEWNAQLKEAKVRTIELNETLDRWAVVSMERFTSSLVKSYESFLTAVAKAGTVELPSFAYRPSTLYDRSRRAEMEMRKRVEQENRSVTGHRGWVLMEFQLVEFVYWQDEYELETRAWLRDRLTEPVLDAIVALRERCEIVPTTLGGSTEGARGRYSEPTEDDEVVENKDEPSVDWGAWLEEEIRPMLKRSRRAVQRSLVGVNKGISRQRLEVLENRIEDLSEKIEIFSEHPDAAGDTSTAILVLPMREWFKSEVARETALRFVEFNERAEALFRRTMATIESIQQVIEFNLLAAEQDGDAGRFTRSNDLATGGLARSERLAGDLHDSIAVQFEDLMTWLFQEMDDLQHTASKPLFDHEIATIEKRIEKRTAARRAERRGSWVSSAWESTRDLSQRAYKRYEPVINDILDDVQYLLLDEEHEINNADIRERLHPYEQAGQSHVPGIYRRLFAPNPLDIADFYVARPENQQRISSAIRDWEAGRPNTILIHGDRGIGKRSMMRHLVEGQLRDLESRIIRVVVDEHAITEGGIATSVGNHFSDNPPKNFNGLRRMIRALHVKPIILIENGEKLYTRTTEGIQTCRSFLQMIDETADRALWVVLMGTPAATLLQTAIEISDYFTHTVHIAPFSHDEIREVIERRHRVSGFRSAFDRSRPRFYEWVISPLESSEIVRDPEGTFFDHLGEMSSGNPLLALEYWLEHIEVGADDDQLIKVSQLPETEVQLLTGISLRKRLILAALVQHNALAVTQLDEILGWGVPAIHTEIDHLTRLGFVESRAGREIQTFQVRDVAEGVVTKELRDMNMI